MRIRNIFVTPRILRVQVIVKVETQPMYRERREIAHNHVLEFTAFASAEPMARIPAGMFRASALQARSGEALRQDSYGHRY